MTDDSDGRVQAWCSSCFAQTEHLREVTKANPLDRHERRCTSCGARTVKCRLFSSCGAMALGRTDDAGPEAQGAFERFRRSFHDEFCAEHGGRIANFTTLGRRLANLADYPEIFTRRFTNMATATTVAGAVVGTAAVIAPVAILAAPAVATGLGAAGVLGAASTGTAISTLSGAALTSASMAALGGGAVAAGGFGMAGGLVVLTAAGAALGGYKGGAISNAYFGEVKDFAIQKVNRGRGPAVVFINGFLTQRDDDWSDWEKGLTSGFDARTWYQLRWESKAQREIGTAVIGGLSDAAIALLRKAGEKPNPLGAAFAFLGLLENPWHTALVKAGMTGVLLADLLARTEEPEGFVLMGHSLGARVIYYALEALATRKGLAKPIVRDVYLLGGAVGREPAGDWRTVAGAVSGKIHNFYSTKDDILGRLYRTANAFQSEPIGLGPIAAADPTIVNVDVSDLVGGHTHYKPVLAELLRRAGASEASQP
jgi:hypothetical protein